MKSDPGRAKVCYRGGFAGFNGGGPIKIGGWDLDDFYVHLKSSVIQIRVTRKKSFRAWLKLQLRANKKNNYVLPILTTFPWSKVEKF